MSEEQLQLATASVLDDLMERDLLFWFHPPNAPRSKITGGKLKAAGMKAGVPDCVVTFPKGQTIFIELKFNRGRLSTAQKDVHARMDRLDIPVYTLWSDNPYTIKDMVRGVLMGHGIEQ